MARKYYGIKFYRKLSSYSVTSLKRFLALAHSDSWKKKSKNITELRKKIKRLIAKKEKKR